MMQCIRISIEAWVTQQPGEAWVDHQRRCQDALADLVTALPADTPYRPQFDAVRTKRQGPQ